MGASYPGKNPHTGQPQGALTAFPPGSNGGVHRGPDRHLRTNAVRAVLVEAMAKAGVRLVISEAGRRRRHRSKIPMEER